MPRHEGMPRPGKLVFRKADLLSSLARVDKSKKATARVLRMETEFRTRITQHIESLPVAASQFSKFNTNPFVLMFHCLRQGYKHIGEIEQDILPAKVFMSMETSSGRMVEAVTLPVYDWEPVESKMHSFHSVIDGRRKEPNLLRLATLKSGPRCLNDEMSKDIAEDIIAGCVRWARDAGVKEIEFTYGVLYGTRKQSNKKDWHILRNLGEKVPKMSKGKVLDPPFQKWDCEIFLNGVRVRVAVRIGVELWNHIARNDTAFMELCIALTRACVAPSDTEPEDYEFTISDLRKIISLGSVPVEFNVSILQRSQLEWLFFFARHFCDELQD